MTIVDSEAVAIDENMYNDLQMWIGVNMIYEQYSLPYRYLIWWAGKLMRKWVEQWEL